MADDYLCEKLPSLAQYANVSLWMNMECVVLSAIDVVRPRWRETPAPLMNTLKSYVEIKDDYAPDKVFAGGEVAAKKAVQQLGD